MLTCAGAPLSDVSKPPLISNQPRGVLAGKDVGAAPALRGTECGSDVPAYPVCQAVASDGVHNDWVAAAILLCGRDAMAGELWQEQGSAASGHA